MINEFFEQTSSNYNFDANLHLGEGHNLNPDPSLAHNPLMTVLGVKLLFDYLPARF